MSFQELFERLIDTRLYASLWFWIALAGLWLAHGARVLGVPTGVIYAARSGRGAGELSKWLDLVLPRQAVPERPWAWALAGFVLAGAAVLGFVYGVDLAQVIAMNGGPLLLLGWRERNLARRLAGEAETERQAARLLLRHRLLAQLIAVMALSATGLWGLGVLISRAFG